MAESKTPKVASATRAPEVASATQAPEVASATRAPEVRGSVSYASFRPTLFVTKWWPNWLSLDYPIEIQQVAHVGETPTYTYKIGMRAYIGAQTKCVKYEMSCVITGRDDTICDVVYDNDMLLRRAPDIFFAPPKTALRYTISVVECLGDGEIKIAFDHPNKETSEAMFPRGVCTQPAAPVKQNIRAIKILVDTVAAQLSDSDADDEGDADD